MAAVLRGGGGEAPGRAAVCLACRTLLRPGEPCDAGADHRGVQLDDPTGRELLVREAWGEPELRWAAVETVARRQEVATLAAVVAFLIAMAAVPPLFGPLAILIVAAGIGGCLAAVRSGLARRAAPSPRGAAPQLPPASAELPSRLGLGGLAVSGETIASPVSGSACLAYAVELRLVGRGGERVMLRDARTCGFDVVLEDGRVARIPPGRIRLLTSMRQLIDVDNLALARYLAQIDPEAHLPVIAPEERAGRTYDPLRYNVVAEAILVHGQRVELLSRFEPQVNARGAPGDYRTAAPSVWVARGVPVLRLR